VVPELARRLLRVGAAVTTGRIWVVAAGSLPPGRAGRTGPLATTGRIWVVATGSRCRPVVVVGSWL